MGYVIENCKGHVHVFKDQNAGATTTGFYEMSPPIPDAAESKALIIGIPLGLQEIVQPSVTLDDKRTLYVFGSAWNNVEVAGMLLLGESGTRGAQLDALVSWYNQNRVSERRAPVRLSLGTASLNAYVVGLRTAQADPKFNTQNFTLQMVTAEIQGQS